MGTMKRITTTKVTMSKYSLGNGGCGNEKNMGSHFPEKGPLAGNQSFTPRQFPGFSNQMTFHTDWVAMHYQKCTTANLPQPHPWLLVPCWGCPHQFCSSPHVLSLHSPDWHGGPVSSIHLYFRWVWTHQQHTWLHGLRTGLAPWRTAETGGRNR